MNNNEFVELPDHQHYNQCADRMREIDRLYRFSTATNLVLCALMLLLSFISMRIQIISLIPSLFGDKGSVAAAGVQMLIVLALGVCTLLSPTKLRIFNPIMAIVYLTMLVIGLFSTTADDIFSILIGAAGCIMSFKLPTAYLDYKKLSKLEGFPMFSIRLANTDEHPEYESSYKNAYHNTENQGMDAPTPIEQSESKRPEKPANGYMDEI